MDAVARLLLNRAKQAEALCRHRTTADLDRLRRILPEADRRFEPSRATSQHVYDLLSRIHYLEAVCEGRVEPYSELIGAPAVVLSSEDQKEFQQAVLDLAANQRKFSEMLTGQVCRDGEEE